MQFWRYAQNSNSGGAEYTKKRPPYVGGQNGTVGFPWYGFLLVANSNCRPSLHHLVATRLVTNQPSHTKVAAIIYIM